MMNLAIMGMILLLIGALVALVFSLLLIYYKAKECIEKLKQDERFRKIYKTLAAIDINEYSEVLKDDYMCKYRNFLSDKMWKVIKKTYPSATFIYNCTRVDSSEVPKEFKGMGIQGEDEYGLVPIKGCLMRTQICIDGIVRENKIMKNNLPAYFYSCNHDIHKLMKHCLIDNMFMFGLHFDNDDNF